MKRSERLNKTVKNGVVLSGGDLHGWPGEDSTAFRAFIKFAKTLRPDLIILNGDVIDGASISRHARIGWETQPTVAEEIQFNQKNLSRVEAVAGKAELIWTLGNHDGRFETRLAQVAPEYADVYGIHLKDHFPNWTPAWSVMINRNTMVKHRWKGGVHAAFNNARDSGLHIVTGHLHSLGVAAFTDYSGTRYGVDNGMLADPAGPQFKNYTEDNPLNWRAGFAVLTYRSGLLLPPELVHVIDEGNGEVVYQGKVITV